ncbi:MAG: recombinase family protein [Fuerstiella sp.]
MTLNSNETPAGKFDKPTGKLVGYARVSTTGQELDMQLDALRDAGCDERLVFVDKASGVKSDRPGLEQALDSVAKGDTLVVWRLDRLGRSMQHLVTVIQELNDRGVGFRSLCDGVIDTTTASGQLIFGIFAALAQFERALIVERTNAGLSAARARGRFGGRPKLSPRDPRILTAKALHADQGLSIAEICSTLQIGKTTLYRWLRM